MASEKEVVAVIKKLKKFVRQFRDPAVTEISRRRRSPFHVLVSCLLSLRTRDAVTRAASERLFAEADSPEALAEMPVEKIEKLIYPVGFYKTKARRIKNICRHLVERGGRVPDTMDGLLELKGVGRKTANITLVYGHNKEGLPVDTHCHRIPNRLGWVDTKNADQTEKELRRLIPKKYWDDFNDVFVTFGQNHCLPRRPKCGTCPVSEWCDYYEEVYLGEK